MIQAVLFDMDGLMIDSELIQSQSFEKVLKEYGKKPIYNKQGIVHTVGIKAGDNWKFLKEKYGIEEKVDVLLEKKRKIYVDLLTKNLFPMPGLIALLDDLEKHAVRKVVVSSSAKKHIELVITRLAIQKYFETLLSGEDVERGKPAPDIYLEAAKQLTIAPSDCMVLEDAASGLQAAKSSGMKVIVIPNKYTAHQDFTDADKIVNSLTELSWSIIENL